MSILAALMAACSNDDWVYRPRDAGQDTSVDPQDVDAADDGLVDVVSDETIDVAAEVAGEDAGPDAVRVDSQTNDARDLPELDGTVDAATDASSDADATADAPTTDTTVDAPTTDAPAGTDSGADAEVVATADRPVDVALVDAPADVPAGPPTLRTGAIVTTGAEVVRSGTLRLTETGFELGGRVCAGPMCLAGGITP